MLQPTWLSCWAIVAALSLSYLPVGCAQSASWDKPYPPRCRALPKLKGQLDSSLGQLPEDTRDRLNPDAPLPEFNLKAILLSVGEASYDCPAEADLGQRNARLTTMDGLLYNIPRASKNLVLSGPPPDAQSVGTHHIGDQYQEEFVDYCYDLFFAAAKGDFFPVPFNEYEGRPEAGGTTPAMDWRLLLNDHSNARVSMAYRVQTSGGVTPGCSDPGAYTQKVPYAAQYYFYGPDELNWWLNRCVVPDQQMQLCPKRTEFLRGPPNPT